MLFTLLAFVFALSILIPFHELGHYWAARLCGVRVLRFSFGFGKILLRRIDRRGTEWAISAIPLGGYVKMQDDFAEGVMPVPVTEAFNTQPVRNRIFIVVAGPLFNFLLAILLYTGLNLVGMQEPIALLQQPVANTAAAQAGFQKGDRIVAIDGQTVTSWDDVRWLLKEHISASGRINIQVHTPHGQAQTRLLILPKGYLTDSPPEDSLALTGLRLQEPRPRVREVLAGSVGQRAGLLPGDIILSVGSQVAPTIHTVVQTIQQHAARPLTLNIARIKKSRHAAQYEESTTGAHRAQEYESLSAFQESLYSRTPLTLTLVPQAESVENGQKIGRIGVQLDEDMPMVTVRYGLLESLWRSTVHTFETAWFSLKMMGRMLTGAVSWRNLSGPVTIADYAGQTARVGIATYVAYLALVSISLGVLNLLPIPMLDGGHLLYDLIEMVRGRPLSAKCLEMGQRAGFGLLLGLMSLALFNDFVRLFT